MMRRVWWVVVVTVVSVQATTFELFELPASASPHPYCNDGSQAGYYHDTDYSKLGKVHVHLQGGNLCDSDSACLVMVTERWTTVSARPPPGR